MGLRKGRLLMFSIETREGTNEGNILFNTFYLRLYSVEHIVKDHSDS